ncbi:MAG: hypothetical protein SV775_08070 [Thermodesulfobacteriota bacterium]|nr:hypothetical protein [Thermodesulfobacteriota bacterium]
MTELIEEDQWVWIVVQDPGQNEQVLGQRDEERDETFIPTFLTREEALQCLNLLVRDKGRKYEVQAIQIEELSRQATKKGLVLFVLNGSGELMETLRGPAKQTPA